jgi:CBS domain-containing protein
MYQAGDVMQRDVICVSEDATVREAMHKLIAHHISGMPVVDGDDRLVGIISEFQLLEAAYLPEVRSRHVGELMTRDVVTVGEGAFLSDITNMMMVRGIRRIPVVRDGQVVGIVARRDVLRYVLDHEEALDDFLAEVNAFGGG